MANQQLSTNTFGVAKWIVSATASDGTHTTIASALTSASSGDTIFIRPGTYTENITLKAGVNLSSFECDALNGNVTIIGKATFTAAGTVDISGIRLQTNSDFFLAVTGTLNSIVNLKNCYLNCLNNTGISYTTSGASSTVNLYNCNGDIGTTGIALHASTAAGQITYVNCYITNSGNSTTASTCTGTATLGSYSSTFFSVFSFTTGFGSFFNSNIFVSSINTTAVTTATAGTTSLVNCHISSGTASAISIGAGSSVFCFLCNASSSNTNTITGAGTVQYSGLTNSLSTLNINVTTQSDSGTLKGGRFQAPSVGFIGEQIRSFLPAGSLVTLTTATDATITSISLTAGIWDISAILQYSVAATTVMTLAQISISTTNNAVDANYGDQSLAFTPSTAGVAGIIPTMSIPSFRAVLTSTTIYYLIASANFTTSTCKAYGRISATRVG